jgi:hypothetical protein
VRAFIIGRNRPAIKRAAFDLVSGPQIHDDGGMTQEPTKDSEPPDRETVSFWQWVRRGALLVVGSIVIYLLLTGPLLWSYNKTNNESWQNFVYVVVSPIIKLDAYQQREYRAALKAAIDTGGDTTGMTPPSESWWLSGSRTYWKLYGDDVNRTYNWLSILNFAADP